MCCKPAHHTPTSKPGMDPENHPLVVDVEKLAATRLLQQHPQYRCPSC